MNVNKELSERQIIMDILLSQRFIIKTQQDSMGYILSDTIRDRVLSSLIDNQEMEYALLKELKKREWVLESTAGSAEIKQTTNKYKKEQTTISD